MISKELLSEVLGISIIDVQDTLYKGRFYYSITNKSKPMGRQNRYINIHELAHKCKEWATSNGWYILSYYQHEYGYALPCENEEREQKEWFDAPTEPEAIFKACEWIMEQQP